MHMDEEFQSFLHILFLNRGKHKRKVPKVEIHLGTVIRYRETFRVGTP